jgi:hypothetical protein
MDIRQLKVPGVKDITATFLKDGVHVASRPGLFCTIALFQVKDYYVEVFYNKKTKEVGRVKTFHGTDLLEPYLKHIDISGISGK